MLHLTSAGSFAGYTMLLEMITTALQTGFDYGTLNTPTGSLGRMTIPTVSSLHFCYLTSYLESKPLHTVNMLALRRLLALADIFAVQSGDLDQRYGNCLLTSMQQQQRPIQFDKDN